MTDHKITLKIATPAGAYENTFAETDTVNEVIGIVVKDKKLVEGDAFELVFDDKVLQAIASYRSLIWRTERFSTSSPAARRSDRDCG